MRGALCAALVLSTMAAAPALAQTPGSDRERLFSSDSLSIGNGAALSADGRWLALSLMDNPATASLWVKPAGGGQPHRITPPGKWDGRPQWSPKGDRLFFYSNRAAGANDQGYYVMVVPVDPQSGRANGEISQVTLDPVTGWNLSPDGSLIAYLDAKDRRVLKAVPSTGGAARVIARLPLGSGGPVWSSDGKSVAFVTNNPGEGTRIIQHVALAGGEPEVIARDIPAGFPMSISAGGEYYVAMDNSDPRSRTLHLTHRDGTVLKSISVNRNTRPLGFTTDGRAILLLEDNVVAPTRVMSVSGGAYRDVTSPRNYYDWVLGWSGDGSTVYTWTEVDGQPLLAAAPVSGNVKSSADVFAASKEWAAEGINSRYVFIATPRPGAKQRTLVAVDRKDNSRHTITESAYPNLFAVGPTGTWGVQEKVLYLERRGDLVDAKEWSGPGQTRVIRSLPASILNRSNIAVHGNRVAWQQIRGDSADLFVAEGTNGEPRRLLSMPAMPGNEIAFSGDGSLLALHYSRRPASTDDLMAIVDVSGATPPRIINTGMSYWYWSRWLPDNSAVLVIGGGAGAEADVVMVPVRADAKPVVITRDDPRPMWGFEVSPDGRFIAYPGEVWSGASIWKFDIADVLNTRR